eukprot:3215832-Amphidinium_carterae.1
MATLLWGWATKQHVRVQVCHHGSGKEWENKFHKPCCRWTKPPQALIQLFHQLLGGIECRLSSPIGARRRRQRAHAAGAVSMKNPRQGQFAELLLRPGVLPRLCLRLLSYLISLDAYKDVVTAVRRFAVSVGTYHVTYASDSSCWAWPPCEPSVYRCICQLPLPVDSLETSFPDLDCLGVNEKGSPGSRPGNQRFPQLRFVPSRVILVENGFSFKKMTRLQLFPKERLADLFSLQAQPFAIRLPPTLLRRQQAIPLMPHLPIVPVTGPRSRRLSRILRSSRTPGTPASA